MCVSTFFSLNSRDHVVRIFYFILIFNVFLIMVFWNRLLNA
nr:MAG TPA: hypothetical protein [Caudoviricetes sp.]